MGKLDINVGDDFPVDEPPPPSPEAQEAAEAAREEWRRRKGEWRQQRDAFREDMRARRDAFKSDVRKSFHENFGHRGYRMPMGLMPRVLIAFAAIALFLALLPILFMFGFFVLAAVLAFFAVARSRHDNYPPANPTASQ